MGDPLKQDDEQERKFFTAQDRANERWGFNQEDPAKKPPTDEEESARERANKQWGMSADELKSKEESADSGSEGSLWNPGNEKSRLPGLKKAAGFFTKKRNQVTIAITGMLVSAVLAFMSFFAPILKLEAFLANINQRAFAVASSAVEARMDHLLDRYMLYHITKMNNCTTVRSIDCRTSYADKGMAGRLFANWQDARIEEKLLDDLGFSVESTNNPNRQAGVHRFTLVNARGEKITFNNTTDWGDFKRGQFEGGNRELGREIRKALKSETKWYNVMQRRSVRKYLERKHGIKTYCFFACTRRDNIELRTADLKTRYKYKFVERFVYPFSGKYGLVLDCLISGTPGTGKCSNEEIRKKGLNRGELSADEVEDVLKRFREGNISSLNQYILEGLLKKVMQPATARSVTSTLPVIGQIYFGMVVVDTIDRADEFVDTNQFSKFAADIKAAQYVEYYAGMRTINDEMKSHALSLEEVGVVLDDFDGAEKSKLYQAYNSPHTTASIFDTKVYAQEQNNQEAPTDTDEKPYVCDNGEPIPAGEYVCSEKKLTRKYKIEELRDNSLINGIANLLDLYDCAGYSTDLPLFGDTCVGISVKDAVRSVIDAVDTISSALTGTLIDAALAAVRHIPVVGSFIQAAQDAFADLLQGFMGRVFPLPVMPDDPPEEKYDGLEAGGDISAAMFNKGGYTETGETYGLGAPKMSDQQYEAAAREYYAQLNYEKRTQSTIARLTDTANPDSLVSQFASLSYDSSSGGLGSLLSMFGQSLANIGSVFERLALPTVGAQTSAQQQLAINAFGVQRYGFAPGDPVLTQDPSILTPEYCETSREAREASKQDDPVTGFDEYTVADPCLLEEVVIEAGGAYFTND